MSIGENLRIIQERIRESLIKSVSPERQIDVIAVTKKVAVDQIQEAVNLGVRNVGENKVQEMLGKFDQIDGLVNWHMIGHLQRNKVKYIVDKVSLIHSVDSLPLMEEISVRALKSGRQIDCLIQVNVSGEVSKFGIEPTELEDLIKKSQELSGIRAIGLMTMAPYDDNPEKARPYFKKLNELFQLTKEKRLSSVEMKVLSMGMSNDFDVAVQEGATMVRIGSALFGSRNYA
ncbi:YggS family pyridoxal phosphate-dependent enzyme [Anoxynatronum sibiricum]|uniref:Pyridoxal phosphate homeostasis protein n=2 Tax=Anoxynatronum sibiricum TaxID=210623 RepID=A0ABU9VQS0_9CLOT